MGTGTTTFRDQKNPLSGLIDIAQENPNDNSAPNYKRQAGSPFSFAASNNRDYYQGHGADGIAR